MPNNMLNPPKRLETVRIGTVNKVKSVVTQERSPFQVLGSKLTAA